jgi:tellurite resistance protein
MDPERIIGELIGGFLGGKQRRSRGGFGLGDLTSIAGHGRRSGLVNAGTLLTVGGLIWGALESMQQGSGSPIGGGAPPPGGAPPAVPPRGVMSSAPPGAVPIPPPLPPIPGATPAPAVPAAAVALPQNLLPLVQLAVSAARADGELSDDEVAVIRGHAQKLGAQSLLDAELQARRPLESITSAFVTPEQRQMAYAIAYAVVHGEGDVSAGERMYLTQLQRLLQLDHQDVERIEAETLASDTPP